MIIDKNDIEKAKGKLGDQNAFLMADLLELDDFDERNLKACCPYHNENTASFIYNKKAHNWHCFGCNTTVDLIDVLMEKGNTFLEATKYLFDKADIQYSFGEKDVKTRHNYRYPHEEPINEKKNVIEYFGKRGISKNVLDYLDVREDDHGNGVFNFYDTNDVLTMVKYRPSHTVEKHSGQPKTWCQKDADTSALLFNMNRVNTSKPLLITEGECFKGDVEILTPNGWVRFDEYDNEKVLQIKEDLSGEFVKPIAKVHKRYSGDMYTLEKGGNFSLTTTKEHNWVYIDYKNRLVKRKICDFPKSIGSGYIPTTIHLDGKGIGLTDNWIALWLAISADGTIDKRKESVTNYCRIQFKKERKIERFEYLLKKCNLEYSKTNPLSNKSYTFFGVKIPKFITKELPWSWVTDATIGQRNFIIDEMVHWDGNHVQNRNQFEYSSKIYHNAILIQTIAHTSGYMSTIMKRKNAYGEWYKVSILFSKKGVSYKNGISDISNYDGDVYCITVPSGMIFVRQNGHITVCGNCDTMSAIESGYLNTVSVPLGAGNLHWIEENWDWLDNFDSIIIWSDNDAPGIKMRKECIYRLGTWRTKYIATPDFFEKDNGKRVPLKDINDCLQVGGKEFVMNLISEAKDVPVKSVVDYSEIDELDISQMDGVKTGIKPLDNELVSLFYGTLTILSGRPGCVDSETEYFNGIQWKKISEYHEGERVLQYNSDGTSTLVYPEQYHKYPCDEFWKLKSSHGINQMLSDEHNLVYLSSKGNLVKKNIIDFIVQHNATKYGTECKFITTFDYNERSGIPLTDEQIRVMCMVISDGYFPYKNGNKCHVRVKKGRKKKRAIKLLQEANIPFEAHQWNKKDLEYVTYVFHAPLRMKVYGEYWYSCNSHQLNIIADECINWDGSQNNGRMTYSTTIKESADFIQFAFSASGYRSHIGVSDRRNDPDRSRPIEYTISKVKAKNPSLRSNSGKKIIINKVKASNGYKYCFTVPSGMLVLRRNGDINITGNSGKTSLIDQAIATTIDDGSPVFLYSKELPERLSANWFNTIIAGRRNMIEKVSSNGKSYYVVPYSTQKKMQNYYNKKLFIYKDEEPNDYESVMKSAEECVRKFGCKLIVLDNLMMIDLKCNESDKNTAQTNLINLLIKFAVKFNVAVVLIAHPRKTQDSNSDIEMYDIAGSSNIINLAMRSIGLRRVSKKEKEDAKCKWKNYDVVLTVMKDRMFGKSDVQIGLWYDLVSRRFYTDYLEYDKQFAWDDNVYTDRLTYVDRTEDNTFPDK